MLDRDERLDRRLRLGLGARRCRRLRQDLESGGRVVDVERRLLRDGLA
jgi:hypothetical protein